MLFRSGDTPHAGVLAELVDDLRSPVGAAVVDHDDVQRETGTVTGLKERRDRATDPGLLVVDGDDDAERGARGNGRLPCFAH